MHWLIKVKRQPEGKRETEIDSGTEREIEIDSQTERERERERV